MSALMFTNRNSIHFLAIDNATALSPTGSDNNRMEIVDASVVPGGILHQQQPQIQQQQQDGGSSSAAPPPFLTKTYDMIDDPGSDVVVSWTTKGASFVVWNPPEFAKDLLPRYFKHNNFSSFVRQLNTYGFRKVDPDRWEFANEGFRRGHKHLLKNIHRRKPSHHGHGHQQGQGSTEITKVGLEGEVERLKRDKNVLMMELVRLRQQQQGTDRELHLMGQRLHDTENRQQNMISFMARAIEDPTMLSNLVHHRNDVGGGYHLPVSKRRRLELCNHGDDGDGGGDGDGNEVVRYSAPACETTRAKLIEFFSRPDLGSKLEVEPLEDLVREMVPVGVADDAKHDDRDCPARATLVEMHNMLPVCVEQRLSSMSTQAAAAAAAAAPPPIVTDVTNNYISNHQSCIDVPTTPPLDLALEMGGASPSPSGCDAEGDGGSSMGTSGGSSGRMSETSRRLFRLVGEVSASVDSGAVGVGMNTVNNNGFWEQFLSSASEATKQEHRKSPSESDSGGGRFLVGNGIGIGIRIGSDQESS